MKQSDSLSTFSLQNKKKKIPFVLTIDLVYPL